MTVYSTAFVSRSCPTTLTTVYTVPTGYTAVVREIDIFNFSGGPGEYSVYLTVSGLSTSCLFSIAALANQATAQWQGRAPAPAGSFLQFIGGSALAQVFIGGYLLST